MRDMVRSFRIKEKRFLRLYSLWQETRREDLQKKCFRLLGEMVRLKPGFSLRSEFEVAF
ncbi:MAG: hypothetical protein KBC91_04690 [Candidatus Omnitrophica bacterium]|nr:hypothetical protein [Candidatus Omnitrophota bacterium]